MLSAKRIIIAVALIAALGAYYHHTHRPCEMCNGEALICCESCDGTGIVKIKFVSVPNVPTGMLRFYGMSRHMVGERRKKLDTPKERICPPCKGTGKSRCPACRSRVRFDLNENNEPIRRHVYSREGKLIHTDDIDPSTLPKLRPEPKVEQIKFVQ